MLISAFTHIGKVLDVTRISIKRGEEVDEYCDIFIQQSTIQQNKGTNLSC